MKVLLKGIYKAIIVVVLVFLILFTVTQIITIGKNEPTNFFGHYFSQVVSLSMENQIMKGDYIIFKVANEYHVDDIIVFKIDQILVVHRIIDDTNKEGYITKGDNNPENDLQTFGYIKDHQIIGKVSFKTGLLGIGNLFLNHKNMIVLGSLIFISLLLFKQTFDVIKIIKNKT